MLGNEKMLPNLLNYQLYGRDGVVQTVEGRYLEGQAAEALRQDQFRRVDVVLAR